MRAYLTLVRREVGTFFVSMTGYAIIASVLLLLGFSFTDMLALQAECYGLMRRPGDAAAMYAEAVKQAPAEARSFQFTCARRTEPRRYELAKVWRSRFLQTADMCLRRRERSRGKPSTRQRRSASTF